MIKIEYIGIGTVLGLGPQLMLKEENGERFLMMRVDPYFMRILIARTRGEEVPSRGGTYDLIKRTVELLGAQISYAVITEIKDLVFYANLVLTDSGGREIVIDSRPSDATLLCLKAGAPIFCEEDLMDGMGMIMDEDGIITKASEIQKPRKKIDKKEFGPFADFIENLNNIDDLGK